MFVFQRFLPFLSFFQLVLGEQETFEETSLIPPPEINSRPSMEPTASASAPRYEPKVFTKFPKVEFHQQAYLGGFVACGHGESVEIGIKLICTGIGKVTVELSSAAVDGRSQILLSSDEYTHVTCPALSYVTPVTYECSNYDIIAQCAEPFGTPSFHCTVKTEITIKNGYIQMVSDDNYLQTTVLEKSVQEFKSSYPLNFVKIFQAIALTLMLFVLITVMILFMAIVTFRMLKNYGWNHNFMSGRLSKDSYIRIKEPIVSESVINHVQGHARV